MLWFVGMGLSGYDSIPLEGVSILKSADTVYVEGFTSPIHRIDTDKIRQNARGIVKEARRWQIEDGKAILDDAQKNSVVMLSYGDPYVATTHTELRIRAESQGIETKTVHAASSLTATIGECGLHHYKVGRTSTIMNDPKSMTTPYYTIYHNMMHGSHSILLLEYNQDAGFFLDPSAALDLLLDAEKGQGRHIIGPGTYVIVASRTGMDPQITAGTISSIKKRDFGDPPHTIIIPAAMHFTEACALEALAKCLDPPQDNQNEIKKISQQMVQKYAPMITDEVARLRPLYKDDSAACRVFENAADYISDAKFFLDQGRDEVAILSIGYADGLADALRIMKGLEPQSAVDALKSGNASG